MDNIFLQFLTSVLTAIPYYLGLIFVMIVFFMKQSRWPGALLGFFGALLLFLCLGLQHIFYPFFWPKLLHSGIDPMIVQGVSGITFHSIDGIGWLLIGLGVIRMTRMAPPAQSSDW